jgi:hypothetical protein
MSSIKRICIYPKDIVLITGKSERYSRALLLKIKKSLSRTQDQFISVSEFCVYTGLDLQEVERLITK